MATGAALGVLCGCHSPWVQSTVVNQQDVPVKLVEVSYPGGSFGVQTIAAHGSYQYRFRILATDRMSVEFTDAAGHDHTVKGPELQQGQEGRLEIEIARGNTVRWEPDLTVRR